MEPPEPEQGAGELDLGQTALRFLAPIGPGFRRIATARQKCRRKCTRPPTGGRVASSPVPHPASRRRSGGCEECSRHPEPPPFPCRCRSLCPSRGVAAFPRQARAAHDHRFESGLQQRHVVDMGSADACGKGSPPPSTSQKGSRLFLTPTYHCALRRSVGYEVSWGRQLRRKPFFRYCVYFRQAAVRRLPFPLNAVRTWQLFASQQQERPEDVEDAQLLPPSKRSIDADVDAELLRQAVPLATTVQPVRMR